MTHVVETDEFLRKIRIISKYICEWYLLKKLFKNGIHEEYFHYIQNSSQNSKTKDVCALRAHFACNVKNAIELVYKRTCLVVVKQSCFRF